MNIEKAYLVSLADKYEIPSFCNEDPSQFLRWYKRDSVSDIECASFIAAMLAFGNRKQFIPKIKIILETADKTCGCISSWLKHSCPDFPKGKEKFYRFYSYDDMHCLFSEMAQILESYNSMGDFFKKKWQECKEDLLLDSIISQAFPKSSIVPKGKNSANKRIHMFLRWMVRQNSSVDLGIWNWYSQEKLLIPLDVHVMQEGIKLGLLPENAGATKKTAIKLTNEMNEVFPGDPSRGDFALFGLGVDTEK